MLARLLYGVSRLPLALALVSMLGVGLRNVIISVGVGAAGLAIFLAVLAFSLVGDGLRDAFDPRLRAL
jgi:ABC-type dipeptide/oligopeptide/nickel transport system permease subunit